MDETQGVNKLKHTMRVELLRKQYLDDAKEIRLKPHTYKRGGTVVSVVDYTDENGMYLGTKLVSKQKDD